MAIIAPPKVDPDNGVIELKVKIHFSKRELEFVQLRFGEALQIKEIAVRMGISPRTAKLYGQKIYDRLGLSGMTGTASVMAMRILVKAGIIKV